MSVRELLCLATVTLASSTDAALADEIVLREVLVIDGIGRAGRSPVHTDAIEAQLVAGSWSRPSAGDELRSPDGTMRSWTTATTDEQDWLRHDALRGGYVLWTVRSDTERVMILHARGHNLVYVNGLPRAGDPYNYGFVRLPVRLERGSNELLFSVRRGRLWARLLEPRGPVTIDVGDLTLPDLIIGESWGVPGGVVIVNATDKRLENLTLAAGGDGLPTRESTVPAIAPMTVRKVPFLCGGAVPPEARTRQLHLVLTSTVSGRPTTLDEATVRLEVRRATEPHRRTFTSGIDGSVQYYAITPMRPKSPPDTPDTPDSPDSDDAGPKPALFLTLHGAGVEGAGQARVYRPKDWGHVVAPTNRRKFGFDWEDWGRLDALEVLEIVGARYGIDPQRTYLTGHSLGGHGVWHLGLTFPDRFAAIGPSAGWVSFFSYAGGRRFNDPDPIEAILARAASPSDTLELARNTLHYGVYILHGEKDDNVPVRQAQLMNDTLGEFHPDLVYHEQPGAGHWWGNQCCDWPAMFEFFQSHTQPAPGEVDHVEFVTANPGVSSGSHWVRIETQHTALSPSTVVADRDEASRRYEVSTNNVATLSLDVSSLAPDQSVHVTIDGQELPGIPWPGQTARLRLVHADGQWTAGTKPPSPNDKGPHRAGPFKDAFRHHMLFVYGTAGTPRETQWSFTKARYDAETFWYRGNGSVDVIADRDFDPLLEPDRSVVLYGNADTNAAWASLLAGSPVEVRRGSIRIGERRLCGDTLACLFIRPRPASDVASVGVVSGSGITGMRLTNCLPYFVSGVAYPDCVVIGPAMLSDGAAGVVAAGFFGNDWSVVNGDFAWRAEFQDSR